MNNSVQALVMNFYNSTITGNHKIQIGQLASSVWNQPHVQVLKNLYDQCKFTGFSIKFRHAGSMVQDDNTLATIPTPVAACILFTEGAEDPSFEQTLTKKPSILLSLSDKSIGMGVPEPNSYKDCDSSSVTWPISSWLYVEPADTSSPSAEYYTEITFKLTFTKLEIKIQTIS